MNWAWIADIGQIIFADIILSGDNALVIGMAAAGAITTIAETSNFYWNGNGSVYAYLFCHCGLATYGYSGHINYWWGVAGMGVLAVLQRFERI